MTNRERSNKKPIPEIDQSKINPFNGVREITSIFRAKSYKECSKNKK